jgi:hypothetical protein
LAFENSGEVVIANHSLKLSDIKVLIVGRWWLSLSFIYLF